MNTKKILRGFVLAVFVAALFLPATSAYAATPTPSQQTKPGWGWGDKNHVHTGPPGLSVKNDTTINISNVVNVMAEAGAQVSVAVYNVISNSLFGNSQS